MTSETTKARGGKTSKRKGETPAQAERRKKIWRHNSFMGHATMMGRQTSSIIEAKTVTNEARRIAEEINILSMALLHELRTRVELPPPNP
jgi:hypothetical protein